MSRDHVGGSGAQPTRAHTRIANVNHRAALAVRIALCLHSHDARTNHKALARLARSRARRPALRDRPRAARAAEELGLPPASFEEQLDGHPPAISQPAFKYQCGGPRWWQRSKRIERHERELTPPAA
eukprot:scaffold208199_cov26-Tisochrysis_lutea.AAC.1